MGEPGGVVNNVIYEGGEVLFSWWSAEPRHIHVTHEVWAEPLARQEILDRGYEVEHEDEQVVGLTKEGDEWTAVSFEPFQVSKDRWWFEK